MDQLATIKPEFKDTKIAFGKYYKQLGEREDLDELAILAHESKNPNLLKVFDTLPPLAELKKRKVEAILRRDALGVAGEKLT